MRKFVAFAAFLIAAPALAADYPGQPNPAPVLRGALPGVQSTTIDWSGFYFGGSAGYANASNSFDPEAMRQRLESHGRNIIPSSTISSALVSRAASTSPLLLYSGRNQSSVMTFGGFLGYNFQSDDTVFGFEADYSRGRLNGERTGATSGIVGPFGIPTGTRTENWAANTRSAFTIQDSGTIRGRIGYANGNFMPYLTAGIAWARASHEHTTAISGTYREVDLGGAQTAAGALVFAPNATRSGSSTRFHFGYALGAGVDVALSQNVFLRAEAIHSRIADVGGANVQINQVRAGAAVKY